MHSVEELRSFYVGGAADAMDESHVQYVQPLTPAAASQFPDFANSLAAPLQTSSIPSSRVAKWRQ